MNRHRFAPGLWSHHVCGHPNCHRIAQHPVHMGWARWAVHVVAEWLLVAVFIAALVGMGLIALGVVE